MPGSFLSGIDLNDPIIAAQMRAQLGDKAFAKLLKRKTGREGNKYGVSAPERRTRNNIVFASLFEADSYDYLISQKALIGNFGLQPRFLLQEGYNLTGKKERPIYYVADFLLGPPRLEDEPLCIDHVVIDSKGFKTSDFLLKKKLFEYRYKARLWQPKNLKELADIVSAYANTTPRPVKQVQSGQTSSGH